MAKGANKKKKQTAKVKASPKDRNAEERRGRRFFFVWVPVIIGVVVCFYIVVFDPPRTVGQPTPGTVMAAEKAGSGETDGKTYTVVLDDGRTVKLEGFQMSSIAPGKRLLVQENVTLIFKRRSFSFVRYID